MTGAAATALRPLTPAETRAVELHEMNVPIGAITHQTQLTAEQIEVAIARNAEWAKLRNGVTARSPRKTAAAKRTASLNAATVVPTQAPAEPDTEPEAVDAEPEPAGVPEVLPAAAEQNLPVAPEPADVAWDTALAEDDGTHTDDLTRAPEPPATSEIEMLLARAQASPQPRLQQLAASVREQLAEIERRLDNDAKIRVLTASAEVLRRQLAQTEAELAELLDAGAEPAETVPELDTPGETAEPDDAPQPAAADVDAFAYSAAVREWARGQGWTVADRGRIPGAVVIAYRNAHP